MHESGIAANLLQMAERVALQNELKTITRVVVAVGALTGVEAHALAFAFGVLAKGTLAEHAELVIQEVPLRLRCRQCECEYLAQPNDMTCPNCRNGVFDVLQGRELTLKTIKGNRDE